MKHIVIMGKYYPPEFGGVERYVRDVARIAAKTHRVTVVVHHRERADRIEHDGNITIIRCGTVKTVSSQPISPSMLGQLRLLQPDLVLFNAPNFWGAGMLLLAAYKAPLLITHHADVYGRPLLKRAVMPIYRHLVRRATYVIVNSLKNASASNDLPRKGCRYIEIPWAVDEAKYDLHDTERTELLAERHQRFGDAAVVGFIGRFVRYKGLSVIVDALASLDGVHALMIGDGPLRSQTEKQVRAAGIAERVHFLGSVDEQTKIRALAMMDVLLLPSVDKTEAFGVAQIEAQLMSVPVIASRLPTGVTDVTIDNQTGLLVPPRDPDALCKAISRVVGDRDLAARLGRAGRARALTHFTFDVFQKRFNELFEATLNGESSEGSMKPFSSPADFDSQAETDQCVAPSLDV